jgi:hypothetical protein
VLGTQDGFHAKCKRRPGSVHEGRKGLKRRIPVIEAPVIASDLLLADNR